MAAVPGFEWWGDKTPADAGSAESLGRPSGSPGCPAGSPGCPTGSAGSAAGSATLFDPASASPLFTDTNE